MNSEIGDSKSAYQLFKFRLFIGCSAIFLLSIAAAAWKIAADYNGAKETTVAQTHNLVLAIEAHIVSDIDKMNAPLDSLASDIAMLKDAGNHTSADIQSILTSPILPSTANYWFLFINTDGIGVAASKKLLVEGVSYKDRDYFIAQKNNPDGGLFIGEPNIGKVSQTRNYFISKRVENAEGEFIGVIVAVVEATPLVRVLEQFIYDDSLSTTVASNRGKIIARVPLFEESFGTDISKSNLFINAAKSAFGTYTGLSVIDKKLRVYSYRAFDKYPLTISVGMTSPLLIDILMNEAAGVLGGLLAVILVLIIGSKYSLKSFLSIQNYGNEQLRLNRKLDAAQTEIVASSKRMREIADKIPAYFAYIDSEKRYQFRNSFYRNAVDVEYEMMIGRTILQVMGAEKYAAIEQKVIRVLKGESLEFELEVTGEDAESTWLSFQYSPDINDDGTIFGFYALTHNITAMKTIQNKLMALTHMDSLTGLPNRTALYERLDEALARTTRRNYFLTTNEKIGCLFLDIDGFKLINDTYGHNCGDYILKEFGARLKACIRQSDMAVRLAGDEFVILLEGLEEPDGAISVAKKIIFAMSAPFLTEYGNLVVTTSIGITVSLNGDESADSLLKDADNALYEAKRNGRNRYSVTNGMD